MTGKIRGSKEKDYLEFYQYWRSRPNDSNLRLEFPYLLPDDKKLEVPLPFYSGEFEGGQILVTRGYDVMFHHLLTHRIFRGGKPTGALTTGQPGTGAFPSSNPVYDKFTITPAPRKNHVSKFHVRAAGFGSAGRYPLQPLRNLPFLPGQCVPAELAVPF